MARRAKDGTKPENASFEQLLAEAETIADRLDRDDVGLDDALALYEQGVGLLRASGAVLARAEEKVKKLTAASDGTFALEDLDTPDDDEDEDE